MKPVKIAVLSSGSGTTAEAFIQSSVHGKVAGEVALVITNNKDAGVIDRVKKLNKKLGLDIKTLYISKNNYPPEEGEVVEYGSQSKAEEAAILKELEANNIDLVLLLGYMKLVGIDIVKKYGWMPNYESVFQARMINTHPGLLPDTKGLFGIHVQEYVIDNKLNQAGHSLFVVDSEYDDGPVVAEHPVKVVPGKTAEELFERVKTSEKKYLAADINDFILKQQEYRRNN